MNKPTIIKGGVAVDDRGRVTFCNDFDMSPVRRMYMLENHTQGFVRAWHGHLVEAKWVCVVSGVAVVGAWSMYYEELEESGWATKQVGLGGVPQIREMAWMNWGWGWEDRYRFHEPDRYTLHPNGDVLYIPPGYANGHMNLKENTRIMHFSDKTMEEADDYRFDASVHGWVWEVKER